jgi:nitrite reductase/ring-hydroxylating ferredoxin subunit
MENRRNRRLNPLIALFTGLSFIILGCDDTYISSIPNYPVSLQLNLTSTYPIFKNSINQFLIFQKPVTATDRIGYGGILVYTGFDQEYYAFDMACPYEAKSTIRVKPNDLGQAICDSCKTVYDISLGLGIPISGPSKEMLRKYKTSVDGDYLYVFR